MASIERRIKELEKRIATSEPITINIHKTVIGMDGEAEHAESKTVRLGEGARS